MKQTIRLTESELREMIETSVNEALEDEGFWGDLAAGAKNAFGGDAERVGKAVQGAYNNVKSGLQNAGRTIQNKVGQFQQGVEDRKNAWKAGAQANANNEKLRNVIKTLDELTQNGVLHGTATMQAVKTLKRQISNLTGINNSAASAYRNKIR